MLNKFYFKVRLLAIVLINEKSDLFFGVPIFALPRPARRFLWFCLVVTQVLLAGCYGLLGCRKGAWWLVKCYKVVAWVLLGGCKGC